MGFSVATTVLSKAASADLTDLATVKDEMSIPVGNTASDGWLSRAIGQMSAAISNETGRTFSPEVVQDSFDIQQDPYPYQTPGGFAFLQLSRWPVLAVIAVTQTVAIGTTQPLTEGKDFRVDPDSGQLLRLNPFTGVGSTWDAIPATVTYLAGFGARLAEAQTVPGTSPYQITVDQAASFSCDQSVVYANGAVLTRVSANPSAGQYAVSAGVYSFAGGDAGAAVVVTYATKAIPADLVDVCLRLVTLRHSARGRDPALVQRETPGVGMERWWFGGAPGQTGQFPPDIDAALDQYRMPVVA